MNVVHFPLNDQMIERHFKNAIVQKLVALIDKETTKQQVVEVKEVKEDITRLDTAEAAKRYRADIKAAQKAGKLPKDMKVSVRVDRFAGGSAIDVSIKKLGFNPVNPEFDPKAYGNNVSRYTDEGKQLLVTLEEMLNKYNYNNSDTMTDYYDVNFYQHIRYDL